MYIYCANLLMAEKIQASGFSLKVNSVRIEAFQNEGVHSYIFYSVNSSVCIRNIWCLV
jgi:hypothetical protein